MAQALGLDAVAEGIENEEQVAFLAGPRLRLGQGFHLAPPLPADEVVGLFGLNGAAPSPAGSVAGPSYAGPVAR